MSDSRSYIQASNEINAFSKIVGKNATDVLKLRKQLINRIKTLIEDNDTKIQDLKQEIEDIQSFDVSDTMEEATKLDRLATNRMYELMVSFNDWIESLQQLYLACAQSLLMQTFSSQATKKLLQKL